MGARRRSLLLTSVFGGARTYLQRASRTTQVKNPFHSVALRQCLLLPSTSRQPQWNLWNVKAMGQWAMCSRLEMLTYEEVSNNRRFSNFNDEL